MITQYYDDTDIVLTEPIDEASSKEEHQDVAGDNETIADHEIEEIFRNESATKVSFADDDVVEEELYSKRSFTPVWKKSDDEKPVWGDEDEDCEDE